jgi:hypothetical protein
VKRWAFAAGVVVLVTGGVLIASPSWITYGCNDAGSNCSTVSPFIVGFVGTVVSLVLLFVGALRGIR